MTAINHVADPAAPFRGIPELLGNVIDQANCLENAGRIVAAAEAARQLAVSAIETFSGAVAFVVPDTTMDGTSSRFEEASGAAATLGDAVSLFAGIKRLTEGDDGYCRTGFEAIQGLADLGERLATTAMHEQRHIVDEEIAA